MAKIVGTMGHDAGSTALTGDEMNDVIFGLAGDDELNGGGGDDRLVGGDGADMLDGGEGSDWAEYYRSDIGVRVNLADGTASGGQAEGDTFASIENVRGSMGADAITGDGMNNMLDGHDGDDTLDGGDGDDRVGGGDGNDMLMGGMGADVLHGGTGMDTLQGGDGKDWLSGGAGADVIDGGAGMDDVAASNPASRSTSGVWMTTTRQRTPGEISSPASSTSTGRRTPTC